MTRIEREKQTVLFGMAKTCQYGGLTILGVEGYQQLKDWLKRKKR